MSDSVHVLMARVLDELPAIGKSQVNKQQGFRFRGIDDVLAALNPVLGRHGVHFVPDVVERIAETRETKGGGVMNVVHLHVRYRFFGPDGDYVEGSAWGEGTDSGDKATNKAMTGALKYMLFQSFAIATDEQSQSDADLHTPEETVRPVAQDGRPVCVVCNEVIVSGGKRNEQRQWIHKTCEPAGDARAVDSSTPQGSASPASSSAPAGLRGAESSEVGPTPPGPASDSIRGQDAEEAERLHRPEPTAAKSRIAAARAALPEEEVAK